MRCTSVLRATVGWASSATLSSTSSATSPSRSPSRSCVPLASPFLTCTISSSGGAPCACEGGAAHVGVRALLLQLLRTRCARTLRTLCTHAVLQLGSPVRRGARRAHAARLQEAADRLGVPVAREHEAGAAPGPQESEQLVVAAVLTWCGAWCLPSARCIVLTLHYVQRCMGQCVVVRDLGAQR